MEPADSIRKLGFRRWYERQLIEGHLHFVTCFLCMIVVAATMDEFTFQAQGLKPYAMLGAAFLGGALGIYTWTRYRKVMLRAERFADGAVCGQCGTYGSLAVTASGVDSSARAQDDGNGDADEAIWIRVRCKRCGHEWSM